MIEDKRERETDLRPCEIRSDEKFDIAMSEHPQYHSHQLPMTEATSSVK